MALKAVLDSLDGVSDDVKALYRAGTEGLTGKFVLDIEPVEGWALEDVGGLRNAFTTQKDELRSANAALEAFKGFGAASTVRDKLAELTRIKAIDPEREADRLAAIKADALVASATSKHATEMEGVTKRADRYRGQLERFIVSDGASAAIAKYDGSPDLLMPHVASRIRIEENDDGTFVKKVLDANGKPMVAWRDGKGVDATVEDLVLDIKKLPAFAGAFKAPASGSGATGGKPGASLPGDTNPFDPKTFNLTEQSRLAKDDPAKFAALKALAGQR